MVARWRELFGLDNERSSSPCCIGSSAGGRDTWLTLVLDPVRGVKQKGLDGAYRRVLGCTSGFRARSSSVLEVAEEGIERASEAAGRGDLPKPQAIERVRE
jgi:hypothetical protein